MRTLKLTSRGLFVLLVGALLTPWVAVSAAFGQGLTSRIDFNGDGFDDLPIGVPGENNGAGGVHILFGSSTGLTTADDQFFTQNSAGINGGEEANDNCGAAISAGDYNGDGLTDLAMGCPGEAVGSIRRAGAVVILYSAAGIGLPGGGSRFLSQDSADVPGGPETDDRCGWALASGDFNGDGFDDLAWGCPGEEVGGDAGAGAVNVLFGSPGGLATAGSLFRSQGTTGVPGAAEPGDACGHALVAADFNGDGRSDLAVGCPTEDLADGFLPITDAGGVFVLFGSAAGLPGTGSVFLEQFSSTLQGVEFFDSCGFALAAADFNGDGRADLAMGCPGEDLPFGAFDVGAVNTFRGTAAGGFTAGSQMLRIEQMFRCGAALAAGDFNGDGRADVASGCPNGYQVDRLIDFAKGFVDILRSGGTTALESFDQTFHQNSTGIQGDAAVGDNFGAAVATGDFNDDGFADLAVGVPREEAGGDNDAGAINVIYGDILGLISAGNQLFTQATAGLNDSADALDQFGLALPGSGASSGPGLTGRWGVMTQTCDPSKEACALRGTFTVLNPSTQSTPKVVMRLYLSADQTLDADDLVIDEQPVARLEIGGSAERPIRIRLPAGIDASGQYVIAVVDAENVVIESNEANNIVAFGPIP